MKTKMNLSSHVLQMKFMRKSAIETQEEIALQEQKKLIDDEHWYLDIEEKKIESNAASVIVENSYALFDGLVFGRMSFNGFNPQVEKLMKPNENESKDVESDHEKEIDDESMANHYGTTLNKTIAKKFSKSSSASTKENHHKVKRLGT